jgi:hypothetical protein
MQIGSNRLIAAGLFLASLAVLAATMYMSGSFGHSLAVSEWNRFVNGGLYLVFEIMTALMALTVGAMITKRRWMLSIIAGGALTVFAVSSIVSLVGFGASNRVAVSALHKQEGEAILQRHEAAVNARLEHAAWLRRTSVDRELPKAERKQLLPEASDQIKAIP